MSQVTRYRDAAAVTGAILLGGICLAGCTGVTTVGKPAHPAPSTTARRVSGGAAVVGSFVAAMRHGAPRSFEVRYLTAGRTSRKIVYAVRPPGGLLFQDTALLTGRGREIVVNDSGAYLCRSPGHARWTCQQLDKASAATQNKSFGVYTVAYWAAFLRAFAHAPGFARYHVTAFTTMRAATPAVRPPSGAGGRNCLDFSPPGTHGIDVICTAGPGILGLVTYHATTFLLESFDPSPPASLFGLPPGATVTRLKPGQQ